MRPFERSIGESGPQIDYDERCARFLESVLLRSTVNSPRLEAWRAAHPAPPHPPAAHEQHQDDTGTICDAVADVGLDWLDPGLEQVQADLRLLTSDQRTDQLREWLLEEKDRGRALARALLARADPERTDELFGWSRTGIDRASYWRPNLYSAHMTYLLETADFGANELIRLLYLLAPTPAHLEDVAPRWRPADALGCDPNFSADGIDLLRRQFTEFKYWMDEPFRCSEFAGHALQVRRDKDFDKALNGHESMDPGRDMTYWSENHRILFAAAEYLAGQFWPDEQFVVMRALRPDPAPREGELTGGQHREKAKRRVLRWLDERLRLGFSEWNAPSYYGYDVMPLLNLVDFAADEQVRTRAAMVLDLLVLDLATNLQGGALAGSSGRVYFEHKKCLWDQATRDLTEVLFGTTGHFTEAHTAAIFLACSPCYRPPDALLLLGARPPRRFTGRSRVSIGFEEAAEHGVGVTTLDDMEFWWSRAAYVVKQTIAGSREVAHRHGLMQTPPFSELIPTFEKAAAVLDTGADVGAGILGGIAGAAVGLVTAGPVGLVAGMAAGAYAGANVPDVSMEDVADLLSVFTEGSLLTRANLYTHHDGGAALSSVQRFRAGQFNFQGLPCVAALANGAMVWTSYPSPGSFLELTIGPTTRSLLGATPIGALIGAFAIDDIKIDEEIMKATHDGPGWWTGNVVQPRVVQQGGAAISIYAAHESQALLFGERTHAWFQKAQFERVLGPEPARCNLESGRWFFGAVGDSYVALFSARECDWSRSGPWRDREIEAEGSTNVFITQIGTAEAFGSLAGFVAAVTRARVHVSNLGDEPGCSYDVPGGLRLSLHYDGAAAYGGLPVQEDGYPRIHGPFARVRWQQDRYAIQHAGRSVVHDVVAGTRVLAGRLEALVHDTPLTYYAQNMALLPWPLYKGVDRDAALGHLVARLRERRPDVVGLSEMWDGDERDDIRERLADLYPHSIEGPHESFLETPAGGGLEVMGGGLLLLSRHPITSAASTIYRQSSGDDGLANKGVLHARLAPRGHPCELDVFLTHTQAPEPTIGGSVVAARAAVEAQIRHLAAFVRACRDPLGPAMLCGDLNVDMYGHRDLYDYLVGALGMPFDPMAEAPLPGRERPLATSESDHDEVSSFHDGHPSRPLDDARRFGPAAERLDYAFCFPGLLYEQHVATSRIVVEQWAPGRDMSDHYGVEVFVDTTTQRLPLDREVVGIRADMHTVRCLQTTGGPGEDEVSITLEVRAGGRPSRAVTPTYEDVEAGTTIDVRSVTVEAAASDEVTILVSGSEDDWIGDDQLGAGARTFVKDELLAVADAGPSLIGCPLLRGDGGEYAVDVLLTVTAEVEESVVRSPRRRG